MARSVSLAAQSSFARAAQGERSWLRHFWTVLGLLLVAAIAFVYLHAAQSDEADEDVFVVVPVKTKVGNDQIVQGKFSLLIDAYQEKGLLRRQAQLETVMAAALAEIYGQSGRPSLARVRDHLQEAVNASLPRKLRVREILIQDFLVGLG